MSVDELRIKLKEMLELNDFSLRQAEAYCGVSFSTLSRFLRGDDIMGRTYENVLGWVTGTEVKKRKQVHSKRITLGKDVFILTLQKVQP